MVKWFPELDYDERRGSKPRCDLLTVGTRAEVAGRLTELAKPYGSVSKAFNWAPIRRLKDFWGTPGKR